MPARRTVAALMVRQSASRLGPPGGPDEAESELTAAGGLLATARLAGPGGSAVGRPAESLADSAGATRAPRRGRPGGSSGDDCRTDGGGSQT